MPRRKTQDEFEKEINNVLGDSYSILGEYINNHTKVKMHHSVCDKSFLKTPKDALNGSGCPFCYGPKPALYNEQWVIDNTPFPYHYLGGFTTMSNKCSFYCDNCNKIFQQYPKRLINEKIYGCGCSPTKKKTHKEFLEELGTDCLEQYEIIDKYINYDTKIRIQHKECNTVFSITPDKFILRYRKQYCPICYYKKSKGEIKISLFLTSNKIAYETNFAFQDMNNKLFDFYLPDYNICIEYDGIQHFQPVDFFGGEDGFIDTQRRDKEKDKYCCANNISLYRIPYWDENNINEILQQIIIDQNNSVIKKYLVIQ